MRNVKVAATQMSCTWDIDDNIRKADKLVREAAAQGAQIILLQELFETPYFCQKEKAEYYQYATELEQNKAINHFRLVAKELDVVLPISFYEKKNYARYNSLAVIDADGEILGKYRKSHIPDGPGYEEKFYFNPGDTGFQVWDTKYAKIGVGICWDQWYPEASRITALMGAEILFYPTAIGWATDQDEETNKDQYNAWQTIQRSHAVANGVPVVSVNRVGFEQNGAMKFWGGSFVTNGQGKLLYLASHDKEEIEVVELDLNESDYFRKHWPFLRDRRIETYAPITKRFIDED